MYFIPSKKKRPGSKIYFPLSNHEIYIATQKVENYPI